MDRENTSPLINPHAKDILDVLHEPLTANEIEEKVDTAIASVYRYINVLLEHDLITEHHETPRHLGRNSKHYVRVVDDITIEFDGELPIETKTWLKNND